MNVLTRVEPEALTVSEAALEMRCSAATVKRWCAQGRLSHIVLPSGRYLVPIDALTEMRTPSRARPGELKRAKRGQR